MQRTNVYLSEEQLRLLKHLAAEERQSVATLVREAIDSYLAERLSHDQMWDQRLTQLLERVRGRIPASASPHEIEADIIAARHDALAARRR
jgi:predicted DNA-binding protein